MKIEEAKGLVRNLLDSVGVTKVYYVDDYLSYDGLQDIMKYIEDSHEDALKKQSVIPELIIETKSVDPDIRGKIQGWWQSLTNTERESVAKECVPETLPHPESKVQVILGDICVPCSPEQWKDRFSKECLEHVKKEEKVLLLLDQKLGGEETTEGEGRTGAALAQSFSSLEGVKENTYCGIFSQSFEISDEFKFRNEHRDQLSSWAFPFSKKRLPDNEEYTLFIEGLNNLFWVGYVDQLSVVAQNLIEETSNRMREELGKILPLEFKQVVIDSSKVEGCREVDTLLRLIHIIFSRELHKTLSDDLGKVQTFNTNVNCIKSIDDVTSKSLDKALGGQRYDTAVVNRLFLDENFVPGDVVNRLLLPLQNGDVFCANDKDYYVLLCQPCNISLRKGGKRSTDIGYFVPLEEIKAEESLLKKLDNVLNKDEKERAKAVEKFKDNLHEKLKDAAHGYSYRLKCSIDGKPLSALVNRYFVISLSILDYCTFSEDGQVIVNKDCSSYLHANQKLLCDNHGKQFSKLLDLDQFVEGLGEECRAVIKHRIESWFYVFLTKLGIKPEFENNRYVFPIKRVGHLQDPLASDLLTQLSHYISRAGLPNEFE